MLKTSIPDFFLERREKLLAQFPGSAFIFPANLEMVRNNDVHHPYRQESSFYYLTGFEEPESYLVITPSEKPGRKSHTTLFVRERNAEKELWVGARYGIEGALQVFKADEAYFNTDFSKKLPALLKKADRVFYHLGDDSKTDTLILDGLASFKQSLGRSGRGLLPIYDSVEAVGELRLFKSAHEIELMRKAGKASAIAHTLAMKESRPGMNEFQVQAIIESEFQKQGCKRLGYGSIVAAGSNATCLHYHENNAPLKDGELLLIDAAGEYEYYTADITRTFPVGKEFTPPQKRIYDLVLKAQKEVIAIVKPGIRYAEMHKLATEILADGLLSLGILKGSVKEVISNLEIKRFYPHGTGHWIGMDVHDIGLYWKPRDESRVLEEGMSFTVEPGLYFQLSDTNYPEEYRGIGIRIEDDIVVTKTGSENLTSLVPKEVDAILALKK